MKALLFDFDGLLMDTESPLVDTWRRIYHRHGVEFPLQTWIEQVVGSTDHPFDPAAHLAETSGLALDMKTIQEEVKRQELELREHPLPMAGSREILAEAKRLGLRQAVVSSSSHEWVESNLEKLGMKPFFEHFTCREDALRTKPAPDLYLKALERLGLPGSECLVFEDSRVEVRRHLRSDELQARQVRVRVPSGHPAQPDDGPRDVAGLGRHVDDDRLRGARFERDDPTGPAQQLPVDLDGGRGALGRCHQGDGVDVRFEPRLVLAHLGPQPLLLAFLEGDLAVEALDLRTHLAQVLPLAGLLEIEDPQVYLLALVLQERAGAIGEVSSTRGNRVGASSTPGHNSLSLGTSRSDSGPKWTGPEARESLRFAGPPTEPGCLTAPALPGDTDRALPSDERTHPCWKSRTRATRGRPPRRPEARPAPPDARRAHHPEGTDRTRPVLRERLDPGRREGRREAVPGL